MVPHWLYHIFSSYTQAWPECNEHLSCQLSMKAAEYSAYGLSMVIAQFPFLLKTSLGLLLCGQVCERVCVHLCPRECT